MKLRLLTILALPLSLSLSLRGQEPDYCQLEHLDSGTLSQLQGLPGTIAYSNFSLSGPLGSGRYVGTLFYDLDAPMSYSTLTYTGGQSIEGSATGSSWALYVYDRVAATSVLSHFSLSPAATESLHTSEINQTPSNGLIEDRVTAYASTALYDLSLFVGENNSLTGPASNILLVESLGGTVSTLGGAIAPLTYSPLTTNPFFSLDVYDFDTGQSDFYALDPTSGPNCTGLLSPVPEPTTALLLGVAGAAGLLRRRRI